VKILKFSRKGRDGAGYKFLVVSLILIMFAVFLIGIQIGRVIQENEKKGAAAVSGTPSEEATLREKIREDIGKMRGKAEEAIKSGEGLSHLSTEVEREPLPAPIQKEKTKSTGVNRKKKSLPPSHTAVTSPSSKKRKKATAAHITKKKERIIHKRLYFQVGVFSVERYATTLVKKLHRQRIPVKIELARGKDGKLLRKVIAGPFYASEKKKYENKLHHITGGKAIPLMRDK